MGYIFLMESYNLRIARNDFWINFGRFKGERAGLWVISF